MTQSALIIFQKNETLGKVKTRLAASVGDQKALEIYQLLIEYTHAQVKALDVDCFIFYSDFIPEDKKKSDQFSFRVQSGKDLGDRMKNAFESIFSEGYEKVAIIGTDCADLTQSHLKKAFDSLDKFDAVIGPALDGGYYLFGMKKLIPKIFNDITWSSEQVFEQTVQKLNSHNLTLALLEPLNDIDQLEDWEKVKHNFKI